MRRSGAAGALLRRVRVVAALPGLVCIGLALSAWSASPGAAAGGASAPVASTPPRLDAPPPAGPPQPLATPPVHETRLPNGLSVAVVPRPGLPLVTLMLVLRSGPEVDPPGRAGVAALTASLLTKGARRGARAVSAAELARQAEALGGQLVSASTWQATTLSMTVTAPQAGAALALLADVARRPLLAGSELERSRAQAADALRLARGNPGEVAAMALRRAFWGDTAHGAEPTAASLRRIARADVHVFHARWFRPDNALLVLAGAIDPAQAESLARESLGGWQAPTRSSPVPHWRAPEPIAEALVLVDMPGSGQSAVMVAAPFVAGDAADRPVARLADAVLGGGYSARLNQEVRIRRGLSYDAGSRAEVQPQAGMLTAQAQTQHASAWQVLQLLRDEIERMRSEAPSADELAARQASLVGALSRRLQTTAGLAAWVGGQWVQRRALSELKDSADELMAVTPRQVLDFARRHWRPQALRAAVAGDLSAVAEAGAAQGVARLNIEQLDRELSGPRPRR